MSSIGTVTGSRDRPEIEKLMGFFLNTLALRTNLADDPTFRELLQRVRTATLAAQAHKDVPFELVVHDLHPQRNFAQNPLFQVLFTLRAAARAARCAVVDEPTGHRCRHGEVRSLRRAR